MYRAEMKQSSSSRKSRADIKISKLSAIRKKLTLKQRVTTKSEEQKETENSHAMLHVKTKKLFQRASPMRLVRLYPSINNDQKLLIRSEGYGGLIDIQCSKLQPKLCKFVMSCFDTASCQLVFPGRGAIPITERSVQKVIGVPRGQKEVRYKLDAGAVKFMTEQLGNRGKKQPTMSSLEEKLSQMENHDGEYLRLFIIYAMCAVLAPTTGIRISPRAYPSLVNIQDAKQLNMAKFVIQMLLKAAKSRTDQGLVKSCMLYIMVKYVDSLELQNMDINPKGTRVSVWTNAMIKEAIRQDMGSDGSFGNAPLKPEFSLNNQPRGVVHEETRSDEHDQADRADTSGGVVHEEASSDEHDQADQVDTSGGVVHEETSSDVRAFSAQINNTATAPSSSEDQLQSEPESILFSDTEKITKFVQMHIPTDSSADDTSRYTHAVQTACKNFESSLQVLLNNLTIRPVGSNKRKKSKNKKSSRKKMMQSVEKETSPQACKTYDMEKPMYESDSDEDYKCEDAEPTDTQTTCMSLEEESTDWRTTMQQEEQNETTDDRCIRRRRRTMERDKAVWEEQKDASFLPDNIPKQNAVKHASSQETNTCNTSKLSQDVDSHVSADITEQTCTEGYIAKQNGDHASVEEPCIQQKTEPAEFSHVEERNAVNCNSSRVEDKETYQNKEGALICPKDGDTTECDRSKIQLQENPEVNEHTVRPMVTSGRGNQSTSLITCTESTSTDANGDFEEESSFHVLGNRNRQEFFEFLRRSPRPQIDIPKFETPILIDFDIAEQKKRLMDNVPMEVTFEGLASVFDGSAKIELHNLLDEMGPREVTSKRKSVSFVDKHPKRQKKTKLSNSPSPHRTRAVVRGEKVATQSTFQSGQQDKLNSTNTEKVVSLSSRIADSEVNKVTPITALPNELPQDDTVLNAPVPAAATTKNSPSDSATRRVTRSSKIVSVMTQRHEHSAVIGEQISATKCTTPTVPTSAWKDPMNRKLEFDTTESERRRIRAEAAPDPPAFELSTPPDEDNLQDKQEGTTCRNLNNVAPEEHDKSPAGQQAKNTEIGKQTCDTSKTSTIMARSITPLAREYQKRVLNAPKAHKYPFVDYVSKKTYTVSKPIEQLYNMVCEHRSNSESIYKKETIIDTPTMFISLANLADSVAPSQTLVNVVCEIGIHIIREENQNPKKYIMPLRIAQYLIECRFDLKDVTRCFKFDPDKRLDHNDLICFPTLQQFSRNPKENSGHYWLVCLNIKARRFEILDSISNKGYALMMDACHILIASIKTIWSREYKLSRISIADFPIEVINSPRQTNTYDCGFFTLMNLENWHGRRVPNFEQRDMPNIRKILTDKWLRWHENKIQWQLLL